MIKFIFLISLFLSCSLFSQTTGSRTVTVTLPVVTLMDVEPAGTITFNYTAPAEAGNAVVLPTSNITKWINYTSAITTAGVTRRITASISQIIPGTDIRIQAAAASGSGGGTLGISSGQIILTTTAQTIISGIGGAFTGNGANNGHQLTISLATNSYTNLAARSNTPIVITYTITE
ncbi:hypothetical protein [Chryseobacterium endophyticum]|uniref:DUF4402 domain-containing protein n=1 Tax=Chryseobacterium endophyticum TaxID=1854762 RepID=A0AAU6WPV9_9FLAO|nr:hypothetical protein [uncultured Chryseobacterium sp.]